MKISFSGCLAAVVLLGSSLVGPASAATLQIQYQQTAASLDQSGWTTVTGNSSNPATLATTIIGGDFVGVTITAVGTHVRSSDAGYLVVDHTDGDLDHLLSGSILTVSDTDNVTLTLANLADGDYSITTYHHATFDHVSQNSFDFDVLLTDSVVTNSKIHDNVSSGYGASVTTATLASYVTAFTVSGGGTVTLTFDSSANIDNDQLALNGFELTAVPEPFSLSILLIGAVGLIAARRRRRR